MLAKLRWRLKWRRECKRRRDEEFRLYRISVETCADEDTRAWLELQAENHALGVW